MAEAQTMPSKQELIGAYKTILRGLIEQRPSGIRLKIAGALGTHKSFVSLITNPSDPTPIPARHLAAIFEVCHLSPRERDAFLAAYSAAHPNQIRKLRVDAGHPHSKTLHLEIPVLADAARQKQLEELIRDFSRRVVALLGRE
jgi:hypothetical protein